MTTEIAGVRFVHVERGDPDAPVALLLHGFPDLPTSFDAIAAQLATAGFRAVAPFMRGYHPSTRSGPFDVEQLGRDAVALVNTVSPDRPVAIVGHDWGAIAAYVAVVTAPERFTRAVTMAVPSLAGLVPAIARMPRQLVRSWYVGALQVPGTERLLASPRVIDRIYRAWSPGWDPPRAHVEAVARSLAASAPAPVLYYRTFMREPSAVVRVARRALRARERAHAMLLHVHGARDRCVGADIATSERAWLGALPRIEIVENAGHFLQLERPERVGALVVEWLDHAAVGSTPIARSSSSEGKSRAQ